MNKCKHPKYKVLYKYKENREPRKKGNFYITNIIEMRECKSCGKRHQKKVDAEITQRQFL